MNGIIRAGFFYFVFKNVHMFILQWGAQQSEIVSAITHRGKTSKMDICDEGTAEEKQGSGICDPRRERE
jgi:hypothetical protein